MRKLDEMLGKGVGRRALRLTSLSFPVEEEICNTGLSHGQKGGWGNEDYARLRSFLVWETVSIKTNYKTNLLQSAVYNQMEETSSRGLTEATLKEHRMQ